VKSRIEGHFWAGICIVALTTAAPVAGATEEVDELIARYQTETEFWKQAEMTDAIAEKATRHDLIPLESWLTHTDRHARGNVAYLFARMGDPRGFDTLVGILSDRSTDRAVGPGEVIDMGSELSPGRLANQIRSDRYYAVHLLGELRDRRAVKVLIPLLDDSDINYKVAWALGQIGDDRAISPLIAALKNENALVRTTAIGALVELNAKSALPAIEALEGDETLPNGWQPIPVGDTARKAAETLRNR
jgi:HEAT repeat protein